MLTAKYRPFCSFCHALAGFTWHIRKRKQIVTESKETVENVKKDTDADADADVVDEEDKLKVVGQAVNEENSTQAVKDN